MDYKSLFLLIGLITGVLSKFPKGFSFGAATSALQTEGAWLTDGKAMTVWDNLAHILGFTADGTTTETTCNSYNMFDQDIAIMKEYGIKHYRMSIQWARVMPYAKAGTKINQKAVTYYRRMLTALKDAGIEAYANLFHNDAPATLCFGGYDLMDVDFPKHYAYYADKCFELFGDLVNYWFTFDEPWCQSVQGRYEAHEKNTKPYLIGHNLLLAHAEAVSIYRQKYQSKYHGKIGFNLNGEMFWPKNPDSERDKDAAWRNLMFQIGWFWNPIMTGDYPEVMKQRIGDRLPKFNETQKAKIKGAADFFALNHYFSWITEDGGHVNRTTYEDDVNTTDSHKPEWKESDIGFSIVPEGMHDILIFIHKTWLENTSFPIFITENGVSVPEPNISAAISDTERVDFIFNYMQYLEKAIDEGVNVSKYFVWTLIDNFEWGHGLSSRFGITRIEYKDNYKRIPKLSLKWYQNLIQSYQ